MLTDHLLHITKASKSGKFETFTTVIIEGDMFTRNTYRNVVCAVFDTVDAAIADAKLRNDREDTELGVGVAGPSNFVSRIKLINSRREFREMEAARARQAEYLASLGPGEVPF